MSAAPGGIRLGTALHDFLVVDNPKQPTCFRLTDHFVNRGRNIEPNPVVFFFHQIIKDDHVANIAAVAMEGIEGVTVSNAKITAHGKSLLSDGMRRCHTWQ